MRLRAGDQKMVLGPLAKMAGPGRNFSALGHLGGGTNARTNTQVFSVYKTKTQGKSKTQDFLKAVL